MTRMAAAHPDTPGSLAPQADARLREALRLAEWRAKDHDDLAIAYNILTDAIRKSLTASPAAPAGLDVERLARAHEDIVTMYANHEPGWDVVHEWHQDPGDLFKTRAAIAAIVARADDYDRSEAYDRAASQPSEDGPA